MAFLCYVVHLFRPQMKEDRERKAADAKADAELRRTLLARQAAHKQATQEEEVGGLACIRGLPPQRTYRYLIGILTMR